MRIDGDGGGLFEPVESATQAVGSDQRAPPGRINVKP